jgi:FeS assembly SUF system protein
MNNHTSTTCLPSGRAQCDRVLRKIMPELNKQELEEKIIQTLKTCYDPEIPVDIFELGLIYEIGIDDNSNVNIKMTLTSPACPVAGSLPPEVEAKVKTIPEVNDAKIEIVWSPPWDKDMMSEVAKVELGFM